MEAEAPAVRTKLARLVEKRARALAQELCEERVRLEYEPANAQSSAGVGDVSGEAPDSL